MSENKQLPPTEDVTPIDPDLLTTTTARVDDYLTSQELSSDSTQETKDINTWVNAGFAAAKRIENHYQTQVGMRNSFGRLSDDQKDDPQYADLRENYLRLGLFGFEDRMIGAFDQLPKQSKDAIASLIIWLDTAGIEVKFRQELLKYLLNATGDNRRRLQQFPNEFKHFFSKNRESKSNFLKLYSFVAGYLQFHQQL